MLRVLSFGTVDNHESSSLAASIGSKFCRCLELAGHRATHQFLGAQHATPREALRLVEEIRERIDLALINFDSPNLPMDSHRHIEQIVARVRSRNPHAWIVIWGSPPLSANRAHNEELLRYNAELHDVAARTGANYFPTQPIIASLAGAEESLQGMPASEVATAGIAAGLAHTYLSQRRWMAA